jgi:hypothetical protein
MIVVQICLYGNVLFAFTEWFDIVRSGWIFQFTSYIKYIRMYLENEDGSVVKCLDKFLFSYLLATK